MGNINDNSEVLRTGAPYRVEKLGQLTDRGKLIEMINFSSFFFHGDQNSWRRPWLKNIIYAENNQTLWFSKVRTLFSCSRDNPKHTVIKTRTIHNIMPTCMIDGFQKLNRK